MLKMRNYIFLEQIDEGTTFKRSTVLGKFHLPTAEEAFSAKREFAINFFKEHYPDADINDFIKNDYSFQKEEQVVYVTDEKLACRCFALFDISFPDGGSYSLILL